MRFLAILAAILFAGCAADPPRSTTPLRNPTIPATWEVLRPSQEYEASFATTTYALQAPDWSATVPVTIPNGTTRVWVEMHFDGGAASNFRMHLAGCSFGASAVPGDGRNVTQDCGGLYPGNATLELASGAGMLQGRVNVMGSVCVDGPYACIRAPP